jgi:hypothetical protein
VERERSGRVALLAAAIAAGAVAAGWALALAASPGAPERSASAPSAARAVAAQPIVLAGRGRRPVWSFVISAPDGSGDLGSATADWTPTGAPVCPASPVPLGTTTEVAVTIDGPADVSGATVGTLVVPADACAAASGAWRGVSGALEGHGGPLALAVDSHGIVRLTFGGA